LPATRALLDIRVVPLGVRAIVPRRLGRGRLYRPRRDGGDRLPALRALGNIGVVALGRRAIIPGGWERLEIDLRGRHEDGWIPIGIHVRVPVRPEGRDDTRPDAAMMPMPAVMPPTSAMPPMPPPRIAWHRTGHEEHGEHPEQSEPLRAYVARLVVVRPRAHPPPPQRSPGVSLWGAPGTAQHSLRKRPPTGEIFPYHRGFQVELSPQLAEAAKFETE
jgi:hypothetical protein